MLDFYIINDDQAKPSSRKQEFLEFVGGLDEVVFENLQKRGIINDRFDYYSDFRLATPLIGQIRENILQKQLQDDHDVKKLLYIFDVAEKHQSGLIAYGD
jgi:hypothetical protein